MSSNKDKIKQSKLVVPLIVIVGIAIVLFIIRINSPAAFTNTENVGPDKSIFRGLTDNGLNYLGDDGSPIQILIYEDYMCPNCKRLFQDSETKLIDEYIATGTVQLILNPIAIVHQNSLPTANAVLCAGDQNSFWEFRQIIFVNQGIRSFNNETFSLFAEVLNLGLEEFNACIRQGRHNKEIMDNSIAAQQFGIIGTPTIVINGERFPKTGEISLPNIFEVLEKLILEINS